MKCRADTVRAAFVVLKEAMAKDGGDICYGKIVIATVEGDIHDIGKNIVKVLLENYGYEVVDLGKDVPVADVVKAVKEHQVKLVGLSALLLFVVLTMATEYVPQARALVQRRGLFRLS